MRLNTLVRNSIAHRCAMASSSSARGRPRILSDIETLDAVFYLCRTGCQWSALQETFWCSRCAWKTIYHRFRIWARLRIFDHVFHDLAKKTLAESSDMMVTDTSFIKNIHGRRDQVLGRNRTDRGRMATKLSLLCNSEGLPLHYVLHCGNKADACLLRHLLVDAERFTGALAGYTLVADKGYDSQTCRSACHALGMSASIPRRRENDVPWTAGRYVVERSFALIDQYRRLLLRFESKAYTLRAFLSLACANLLAKHC